MSFGHDFELFCWAFCRFRASLFLWDLLQIIFWYYFEMWWLGIKLTLVQSVAERPCGTTTIICCIWCTLPQTLCGLTSSSSMQYGFSIFSIASSFLSFITTSIVSVLFYWVSLARLDMKRLDVDWLSDKFDPARKSYCAAIMMDHENTNPIKMMAQTWFCSQLQQNRQDEVQNVDIGIACMCNTSVL